MGRAGGGGFSGGGGIHSTGGHSMGHSSSGHHVSGSGSGRGYGPGPGRMTPPPPIPPRRHYGSGYGRRYDRGYEDGRRSSGGSVASTVTTLIVIALVVFCFVGFAMYSDYRDTVNNSSTIVREKLESGNGYINDCIKDELHWFDNESKTETQLKEFWEQTGVQPYIYLRDYDASLQSESDKEAWATAYYETEFSSAGREDVCLYVYFAEQNTDGDVGYMTVTEGYQAGTVMDAEAESILWKYIDNYWYSDASTDEVFTKTFEKTGSAIMQVGKTVEEAKADFMKSLAVLFAAIAAITGAVVFAKASKEKQQREKEKEEATERMLNTPLETFGQKETNDAASELAKKYEDTKKSQETAE